MRKQTKLVAVVSAAALLAIGASMTSFAATGWVEEDGTWYYYDNDGNRVTDEWKRSGNNWYWLDGEENGAMATEKLIEDGDHTYYVDGNGVMVTTTWVRVVNEDQDDDTDPAEYRYYYMQANGKAYKTSDSKVSKKTIEGKKYAFDSDGKMLYGWVGDDASLQAEEEGWKDAEYYFGNWDDGSMKTGWQLINVYDAWDNEDEDADYWFYFGSNGKKRTSADISGDSIRINGQRYTFDETGAMKYKWLEQTPSDASTSVGYKYYGSAEDGARKTKGWFKVVPNKYFDYEMSSESNDEAQWYYADGSGDVYKDVIKKINGKYYAFDEYGAMISGLVHMDVDDEGKITAIYAKEDDKRDEYSTVLDSDYLDDLKEAGSVVGTMYYFGNPDSEDSDGAMKTGNTTLSIDGSSYTFSFATAGGTGSRGAGKNGVSKKVYYKYGMRMSASSEDKYRGAIIDSEDIATFVTTSDLRDGTASVVVYNEGKSSETKIRYYSLEADGYQLIGTNGKLKTKANGVKDGEDWYFFSNEDGVITYYADDKNLLKALDLD